MSKDDKVSTRQTLKESVSVSHLAKALQTNAPKLVDVPKQMSTGHLSKPLNSGSPQGSGGSSQQSGQGGGGEKK